MPSITEIKVRLIPDPPSRAVAFVTIVLDDEICIRDIRLIKGDKDDPDRFFCVFPRRGVDLCSRCSQVLKAEPHNGRVEDVAHPINHVARKRIESAIVAAYLNELSLTGGRGYQFGRYVTHRPESAYQMATTA